MPLVSATFVVVPVADTRYNYNVWRKRDTLSSSKSLLSSNDFRAVGTDFVAAFGSQDCNGLDLILGSILANAVTGNGSGHV